MILAAIRNGSRHKALLSPFWSTASRSIHENIHPNPPLDLDPSLRALLNDVDIALDKHKNAHLHRRRDLRELEPIFVENSTVDEGDLDSSNDVEEHIHRKSPAALYGSQRIGAVVLPVELQNAINLIISESDKHRLHQDAKRLFLDAEDSSEAAWDVMYNSAQYRSRKQAARHQERDGTAFVSVALPAHFSAISSVLNHLKSRMEPEWRVERVIDWGTGTGSGLWASLYSFQNSSDHDLSVAPDGLKIANSSVVSYTGIDKRDGLVTMGKRLLRNLDLGRSSLTWQKSFKDEDKIGRSKGQDTLALSAFMLSSLPNGFARKTLVKEMWESGAHTIVLIDHSTTAGFEHIAEARHFLLDFGQKEIEDPEADDWPTRGCHVVAPCPHDAPCPLYDPGFSRLVCGFSQRLQRPSFVRRTKHSSVGHEDIEYSYVVIRRGPRPSASKTRVGRIGEIGRRELEKIAEQHVKVLTLHDESENSGFDDNIALSAEESTEGKNDIELSSSKDLGAALRQEAYHWPRLVFPPLKKSGHIILDGCTPEGKIMRLTIPRSQGKQPYYDARKSTWGDLFPHEPKNAPQVRCLSRRSAHEGSGVQGSDIGKRKIKQKGKNADYDGLASTLKEQKRQARRERLERIQSSEDDY